MDTHLWQRFSLRYQVHTFMEKGYSVRQQKIVELTLKTVRPEYAFPTQPIHRPWSVLMNCPILSAKSPKFLGKSQYVNGASLMSCSHPLQVNVILPVSGYEHLFQLQPWQWPSTMAPDHGNEDTNHALPWSVKCHGHGKPNLAEMGGV